MQESPCGIACRRDLCDPPGRRTLAEASEVPARCPFRVARPASLASAAGLLRGEVALTARARDTLSRSAYAGTSQLRETLVSVGTLVLIETPRKLVASSARAETAAPAAPVALTPDRVAPSGVVIFAVKRKPEYTAVAGATLRIQHPNGSEIQKTTNASGEVQIEGKPGETYTLLEVLEGTSPATVVEVQQSAVSAYA
jgi:hypothetical protein